MKRKLNKADDLYRAIHKLRAENRKLSGLWRGAAMALSVTSGLLVATTATIMLTPDVVPPPVGQQVTKLYVDRLVTPRCSIAQRTSNTSTLTLDCPLGWMKQFKHAKGGRL